MASKVPISAPDARLFAKEPVIILERGCFDCWYSPAGRFAPMSTLAVEGAACDAMSSACRSDNRPVRFSTEFSGSPLTSSITR